MVLHTLFISLSVMLTLLFFLYGFNQYYLLRAVRRYTMPDPPNQPSVYPHVTVQLPVYNERYVIDRLLAACTAMAEAYGKEKVKIQVLDDSTDDTSVEIDRIVKRYVDERFDICVLRRTNREGFKAGALKAAFAETEDEFIAIFDADFIPPADYLLRTMPYFTGNERLGIVQSRWTHLNRDFNSLTTAIALGIDAHFIIEQPGRYAVGCFQNFNGSGGVLRTKAVAEAGGWQADTLAEDLDLSYRMQNLGYTVVYLRDLHSPGEVPPTVPSYKRQQARWACGSLRTARKLLPTILCNRQITWRKRLEAFIHLTGYMVHPMIFFSFVMVCLAALHNVNHKYFNYSYYQGLLTGTTGAFQSNPLSIAQDLLWVILLFMIVLCTIAPWIMVITTLRIQKLSVSRNLHNLVILFLLGYGVSLSNTIEAGKALLTNRNWAFQRTPKYAHLQDEAERKTRKYQVPLGFVWILELGAICLGAVTMGFAVRYANYGVFLVLIPYMAAFSYIFIMTLVQSRAG